ncbi:MAG: BglG family transcription antiterminator [Clostridia bacterium]|nr:BglG family transcription antiterminator [Clostridia bacterium]
MNNLSQRQYSILRFLIIKQSPVTAKEIADNFNVSIRTVRYDLDDIEKCLKKYDIKLIKKNSVGMWINGTDAAVKRIGEEFIEFQDLPYRVLTKDERVKKIISILLEQSNYIPFDQLAEMIIVSRSTVIKDMAEVEAWFNKRHIDIIRKTKLGIKIRCGEKQLRKALIDFINENVDSQSLYTLIKESTPRTALNEDSRQLTKEYINTLFDKDGIKIFQQFIGEIQKELGVIFSDNSVSTLMIHYGIAVKRVRLGKKIYMPQEQLEKLKAMNEFKVAQKNIRILENGFNGKIPESEIGYIALHLIGAKVAKDPKNDELIDIYGDEINMIDQYIQKVSTLLGFDLTEDQELRKNLLLHLKPTFNRIKYNMTIVNPILQNIKTFYPIIFNAAKEASDILSDAVSAKIEDDEIGFITMHVGACIERKKRESPIRKFRALIACASSIGTSKLLASRINCEFKEIYILDEVSIAELNERINDNVDLIITTVPIDNILLKPVVTVSPFLTEKDKIRIRNTLMLLEGATYKHNIDVEALLQIINKYCIIEDKISLEKQLNKFLNGDIRIMNREDQKLLSEMIDVKRTIVNAKISSKEEAIRLAGKLLLDDGYINDNYIEAMLELSSELSSYLVIAPGIAMPHARPERGALKAGFSILTIQEGINFGHEKNDPVRIVFALAAVDNNSHLRAMSELSMLLNEENNVEMIKNAKQSKEIINIINDFERSFLANIDA